MIFAKRVPDPSVLDDDDEGGSPKDIATEMIAEWGSDGALNQTQFFALLEDNDFWPLMSVWGGSEDAPAVERQPHASEAEVCSPHCASSPCIDCMSTGRQQEGMVSPHLCRGGR